jgi:sugar lactone lactonase YvrE
MCSTSLVRILIVATAIIAHGGCAGGDDAAATTSAATATAAATSNAATPPAGALLADGVVGRATSFTTLFKAPISTEGLTADAAGSLYTAGRGGNSPCPVWRIAADGSVAIVGNLPPPCSPAGLAFDQAGTLFVTNTDKIFSLVPDAEAPPTATLFASGAPGANGVAFDRRGNLWVTDGVTAQGRVFRISPDGTTTEAFRIPALASDVNAAPVNGVVVGGVGRDNRALPAGTVAFTAAGRAANDAAGSVGIVANGIAFDADGDTAFVADTARGAIWRVEFDRRGEIKSPFGCDVQFPADTLCLDNLLVEHPAIEGLDGIALDIAGTIWGTANERNAVVRIARDGRVTEVFRNPADATSHLRNAGPLEFPTSPVVTGHRLCLAQTDGARRDNAPNTLGEVAPGTTAVAKVACLDQRVVVPGLALPIH